MRKWPLYTALAMLPLPCYADFNISDRDFFILAALLTGGFIAYIIAVCAILAFLFNKRGSRKLHIVNAITAPLPAIFLFTPGNMRGYLLVFPLSLVLTILHLTLYRKPAQGKENTPQ